MAYNLRSRSLTGTPSPKALPEVMPASPGCSREGTGASHKICQKKFLEMMGLLEETKTCHHSDVLTQNHAEVLASALNHSYYEEMPSTEQYFTTEEYRRICRNYLHSGQTFLSRGRQVLSGGENGSLLEEASHLMDNLEREPIECNCPAHIELRRAEKSLLYDTVAELMIVPKILNDHWGGILASALLPVILKILD